MLIFQMEVTLSNTLNVNNNVKFYTILFRKRMNNSKQIYTRAYVAYGTFISVDTFKYHIVYNNKLLDDLKERYCTLKQFLRDKKKKIYVFSNLEDAIEQCKTFNEDFKKIKLK